MVVAVAKIQFETQQIINKATTVIKKIIKLGNFLKANHSAEGRLILSLFNMHCY